MALDGVDPDSSVCAERSAARPIPPFMYLYLYCIPLLGIVLGAQHRVEFMIRAAFRRGPRGIGPGVGFETYMAGLGAGVMVLCGFAFASTADPLREMIGDDPAVRGEDVRAWHSRILPARPGGLGCGPCWRWAAPCSRP